MELLDIFNSYDNLMPFYKVVTATPEALERNSSAELTSLNPVIDDTIQSISITQEEGVGSSLSMQFEYGVGDFGSSTLPPLPFFQPNTTDRRVAVFCGYNGIDPLKTKLTIPVVEIKTEKNKVTNRTVKIPGQFSMVSAKFVKTHTLFTGLIERPQLSGDRNGRITVNMQARNSITSHFLSPKNGVRGLALSSLPIYKYISNIPPGKSKVNLREVAEKIGESIKVITDKRGTIYTYNIENRVSDIDIPKLLLNNLPVSSLIYGTAPLFTTLVALTKPLKLGFTIGTDPKKFIETITIYDNSKNLNLAGQFEGLQKGIEYALDLRWGHAVLDFSYSSSSIGGMGVPATDGFKTTRTGTGIELGFIDEEGYHVTYEISFEKISTYVDANGATIGTAQAALDWAKRDPQGFITSFTTLAILKDDKPPPQQTSGIGSSGISLNLTMRYPIPGMSPGVMIYFDIAGRTPEEKFPKFLRRFYKVIKVVDVFSAKENIWEQTLECVA